MTNINYTDNDLYNVIALCEQDEENIQKPLVKRLISRCQKALAYTYEGIRFTAADKAFLAYLIDNDMDQDARVTIRKITGI